MNNIPNTTKIDRSRDQRGEKLTASSGGKKGGKGGGFWDVLGQ